MKIPFRFRLFKSPRVFLLAVLSCWSLVVSTAGGVTRFGLEPRGDALPPSVDFDDIWFYDDQMVKVLPRIDLQWLTAVMKSPGPDGNGWSEQEGEGGSLRPWAEAVAAARREVSDYLCDQNLAGDACFFRLRRGIDRGAVATLIQALNRDPSVRYAHPAIRIEERSYAFFNALRLEWKSGVSSEVQERIIRQAHLFVDEYDGALKVDIFRIPFFRALRWLAEDIHVLRATPHLVELKPSIEAKLILPMSGSQVGDPVPFTLHVAYSDAVGIDPSSIATVDVRLAGIPTDLFEVRLDPYDHVAKAATSPIAITGRLRIFAPGEYFILPVRINYTCLACSDREVRAIETEKTAFRVASLVPRERTGAKLIVPAGPVEPEDRSGAYRRRARRDLALTLLSFAMAGLLLVPFVRRGGAGGDGKGEKTVGARADRAAQRVVDFLEQEPAEPHWSYLGEASKRLREYLALTLDMAQDPLGGTGRLFFESVQDVLSATEGSRLESFFRRIDDIVAREVVREPDVDALRLQAMEVVAQMKQRGSSAD